MSLLGFKRDPYDNGDPYPHRPARTWSHANELAMGVVAVLILTVAFAQTRPESESSASSPLVFDESAGREADEEELTQKEVEQAVRKAADAGNSKKKKKKTTTTKKKKEPALKAAPVSEAPAATEKEAKPRAQPRGRAPAKPAPRAPAPAPRTTTPPRRTFTGAQIRRLPDGSTLRSVTSRLGSPLAASDMRQRFSAAAVRALLDQAPPGYICRYWPLAPGEPAPYVRLCFNANGALRTRDFVAPVG